MKKSLSTFVFSYLLFASLLSQDACDLVSLTPIHDCITTVKDIQYGVGKQDYGFPDVSTGCAPQLPLFMDVYQPCENAIAPRPLVIFIHGGAFAYGNKSDMAGLCDAFARRGYVAATISYRLSMNLLSLSRTNLIRAGARALQDARCAVRYFKAHADSLGIDTTNIMVTGYSAGAVTALNMVFTNDPEERPVECDYLPSCGEWFGCPNCPDLGDLEGTGGWQSHTSGIRAAASLAGAVMDLNLMDDYDKTPVFMVHGTADETVAYDSACFLDLVPCPKLYGSHVIQQQAESLGLCTSLHTIPSGTHDMAPHQELIIAGVADFFKKTICQDDPCLASGSVESEKPAPLLVFPNPAGDFLQVNFAEKTNAPQVGGQLLLADLTGRQLRSQATEPGAEAAVFSLEGLPQGFYFLNWKSEEGSVGTPVKIFKR
ncbi:MAG: carboxylesterase family protein [Bacteroidota bacterium]